MPWVYCFLCVVLVGVIPCCQDGWGIDEYLRADPFSLTHALERIRRAIHYEELERREGEDWSIAKNYVRSLLRRMT